MKALLCCLFSTVGFAVSMAESPQSPSAKEIATKLYSDFDVDLTRGCALSYVDMVNKLEAAAPENLRADVLCEIVERAISTHDPIALHNVFFYFSNNWFTVIPWNERLENLLLGQTKNHDVDTRLYLADALPGFPETSLEKFRQILLEDPSPEVRRRVTHSQKEIEFEKSQQKAK